MAATVVVTKQDTQSRSRPVRKYIYSWVSHTDGAVALATVIADNPYVSGEIVGIITVPDAVDAPTDNYDATLVNEEGLDVARGLLANRDVANVESVSPVDIVTDGATSSVGGVRGVFVDDKLRITVAAAGSGKKGKIVVLVR